jgi:nucleoid-associated protein YgaU
MSSTRVRRRRILLIVGAGALLAAWMGPVSGGGSEPGYRPVASSRYVVRGGDTLWAIAERVAPSTDPRRVVDAIAEANAVDAGMLVPGQTLVIPGI